MTEKLNKVGEMITRWIGSCITDTQLDVCTNSIENCIGIKHIWTEDLPEEVDALVDDLKAKVDHKRHSLSAFPGATIPLPGANYEETEK